MAPYIKKCLPGTGAAGLSHMGRLDSWSCAASTSVNGVRSTDHRRQPDTRKWRRVNVTRYRLHVRFVITSSGGIPGH